MKKIYTQTLIALILFMGTATQIKAQCSFSGLSPAYCRNAAAVSLTAGIPGGSFSGPGISGNIFDPALAGAGTHTITYAICTNSYQVSSGTYSFNSVGGNAVNLTDDATATNLSIGFPFQFFCTTYTSFVISSNGFISFDQSAGNGCCSGQLLPSTTTPNNLISLCWEDFNPSLGGTITYTTIGNVGSRICIVTYSNVQHYGSGNPITIQAQLYEGSNNIEIHTTNMPSDGGNHTMGIENASGSTAFVITGRNAANWSASNEMQRFSPINNCITSQTTSVDATSLTITGPSTLCLHSTAQLTGNGTNTYTWNTSENTAVITVTPTGTTVYNVTGAAPGTLGCVYNTTHTITVYSTPLNASSTTTMLCVGSTATLTGSGASTYTWSTTEQQNAIQVSPLVTTTYTLSGTSGIGCEETMTITQDVNTNTLTITSNTAVCDGKPATLEAGSANSFTWGTVPPSPFAIITVTPNAMTVYSVSGTDQFGCVLSAYVTVSVHPNPNVTLVTPKSTVCKGDLVIFTAGGGTTYQWSHGTSTSNTASVIPNVDLPLTVTVTGTNQFGCTGTNLTTISVSKCIGISETGNDENTVQIFPNPGTGIYQVKNSSALPLKAEVYNGVGALIETINLNTEITRLDLSAHAAGVYFINVKHQDEVKQVTRVIKQ